MKYLAIISVLTLVGCDDGSRLYSDKSPCHKDLNNVAQQQFFKECTASAPPTSDRKEWFAARQDCYNLSLHQAMGICPAELAGVGK